MQHKIYQGYFESNKSMITYHGPPTREIDAKTEK